MDERERLLQQWEVEVCRVLDAWPPAIRAVAYRYQYHAGMRISDTQRIIDAGLKEVLGNGHR